jgi:predicted transglutaminase-like cysteine proteinase
MFAYARRTAIASGLALVSLGLGTPEPAAAGNPFMDLNGSANAPIGYVEFCRNAPDECAARGSGDAERLTEARWRELREINSFVNRVVTPATDLDFYRREEVWALPETYGDCEDYVLLKRKWLIERGWPTGSLLVTVVFDEAGDGHAVLLVRTDRGELVLDNKSEDIRVWFDTAYRFVKRQSVGNPNRWVSVGDPRWTTSSTAAPR